MTGDRVAYEQHDAYATSMFALNVEREVAGQGKELKCCL
jgi:hypothetical protein